MIDSQYNSEPMISSINKGRRSILKAVLLCTLGISALPLQRATAIDERRLAFFHTHTGKHLDVVYKRGDDYVPEGLREINEFLFDFRTGDVRDMDPHLLDLAYDLRETLGGKGTYEVISAFRSPKTNEMLRSRSGGVVKNSQHLYGKAIDIRLTDVELSRLRDTAIAMKRGGVGYYASSNFVHIDTGRVRRW